MYCFSFFSIYRIQYDKILVFEKLRYCNLSCLKRKIFHVSLSHSFFSIFFYLNAFILNICRKMLLVTEIFISMNIDTWDFSEYCIQHYHMQNNLIFWPQSQQHYHQQSNESILGNAKIHHNIEKWKFFFHPLSSDTKMSS